MWDLWVITAANKKQKEIFEIQINHLITLNKLPGGFIYTVIADPEGIRVGSGGATINVFNYIKNKYGDEYKTKKIVIIHSGGFSKRLPTYSVKGKLFSNIIDNGKIITLMEYFYHHYKNASLQFNNGMLIASGDVQIDLTFNEIIVENKIYGFSVATAVDVAKNHGVYVTDSKNDLQTFLHKEKIETLHKYIDKKNQLEVDTGILFLPFEIVNKISNVVGELEQPLNLYNDFIIPLSKAVSKEHYLNTALDGGHKDKIIVYREKLYKLLHPYSMKIISLKHIKFIHIGTTKQYISALNSSDRSTIIHSIIKKNITSGNKNNNKRTDFVVEDCILLGKHTIGKHSLVSDVISSQDFVLETGYCLSQVAVCIDGVKGYITKLHPVEINPKTSTMLYSWDQPLFSFDPDREVSLYNELNHKKGKKYSFHDCFKYCDVNRLIDDVTLIDDRIKALEALSLENKNVIDIESMKKHILNLTPAYMAHTYQYLSKNNGDMYQQKSFNCIKEQIISTLKKEITIDSKAVHNKVKVKSAIRVNAGGSWTDTPPYCYENGGRVLNFSVLPNHDYPVEVTIEMLHENQLIFKCEKQHNEIVITSYDELINMELPDDFHIHKQVCIATGLITKEYIKGCKLTIHSKLPKGSGLGTSSILVNACLIAIHRSYGITYGISDTINKTLQIEQLMGTGGGWQDQAGVLSPGIKITTSKPGWPQQYEINSIKISNELLTRLNDRFVLIYTGKRRKAKNILQQVVSNYLVCKKGMKETYQIIKELPIQFEKELLNENIEEFSSLLTKSFMLNKKLFKGCSNKLIEDIIILLKKYISGYTMCGAGGGGYLFVVLKKGHDIIDINKCLVSNNSVANAVSCSITNQAIKVITE